MNQMRVNCVKVCGENVMNEIKCIRLILQLLEKYEDVRNRMEKSI